jgi:hypothetical protein
VRPLLPLALGLALGAAAATLLLSPLLGAGAGVRERDLPLPLAAPKVEYAPALAPLGDGSAVYTDGTGRLFHLRSGPEGLTLAAVHALRRDIGRHPTEPALRAPHGYYLDDIGAESLRALERAKERFAREARSGAVDAKAYARIEAEARSVLAWGDAGFLLAALSDRSYGARRAAAIVLGGAGYGEARSVLQEVATESEGDGAERARRLIESLDAASAGN